MSADVGSSRRKRSIAMFGGGRGGIIAALLLLVLVIDSAQATFTEGFQTYLSKQYGAQVAQQLTREDLGVNGSFGGNHFSFPIRVYRDPVIFVHGLNTNAGGMLSLRDFFYQQTYGVGELYATSYGPKGASIDASSAIECSYVKQIRQLISAVSAYTGGRRVVVAGYSMGVAVARKAILGGACVDTKENIGDPLTNQISAFLSVAGANQGAVECNEYPTAKICNSNNGFKAGSAYLRDINSQKGYEGQARYAIASKTDDVVGFANLTLPGAQINITLTNFTHGDTCYNTANIQLSLVNNGFTTQFVVNKDAYAESKLTDSKCTGEISGGQTFQYGPHASASRVGANSATDVEDGEYHGEYNRQTKTFTFFNGYNYFHHANPSRGNYFKVRSSNNNNNGRSNRN